MNLLNLIEDQNTGYENLRALMRAVDNNTKAMLKLGGETVTLEYPEARFMLGKYKAYNKAGRQDEFLRDMGDPRQFDLHMKQLRDLIQKQKDFRGSISSERAIGEENTTSIKKKESKSVDHISTSTRTDRMLSQLRAKNPQAENDLEALIYDANKQRQRQDQDERDIARLDFENDREEADIDRLEREISRIKRGKVRITAPGDFQGRTGNVVETHAPADFVMVDVDGFGHRMFHASKIEEMQTDINRFNIDRPMLPSGMAKIKYARDNDMYDDARVQESLRDGEWHEAEVVFSDGTKKTVKITSDEGFRDRIIQHFARQGKDVADIKVDWSVKGPVSEEGKKDACYHKVKSRYKVWPSAYASGALVQCRKQGAANWGTGGKKK